MTHERPGTLGFISSNRPFYYAAHLHVAWLSSTLDPGKYNSFGVKADALFHITYKVSSINLVE